MRHHLPEIHVFLRIVAVGQGIESLLRQPLHSLFQCLAVACPAYDVIQIVHRELRYAAVEGRAVMLRHYERLKVFQDALRVSQQVSRMLGVVVVDN